MKPDRDKLVVKYTYESPYKINLTAKEETASLPIVKFYVTRRLFIDVALIGK